VSVRSVFHHFPDLDNLLAAAAAVQAERHWSLLTAPDQEADWRNRLGTAVRQRSELFERIAPVRRAAARQENDWPGVAARLDESRAALRRHIRLALSPEIHGMARRELAGIEAAASWETWEVLRRHQRLSVGAAASSVEALIAATVESTLARQPAGACQP
jgi:AcrR family transcriptional regulator